MNKNKVFGFIGILIILGIIIFFVSKPSSNKQGGDLPDWVLKPKADYSGLYCGVYSSDNTMLQRGSCIYPEQYVLNERNHRFKSLFGPKTINPDLRFAVFNIDYNEAISGDMGKEELLNLEIEEPYEAVYFCGFDNTPQEYWDCIKGSENPTECQKFYNLKLNSYIDNNQLDQFCIKVV